MRFECQSLINCHFTTCYPLDDIGFGESDQRTIPHERRLFPHCRGISGCAGDADSVWRGVFIPWSSTPFFWRWLQEISLFTHATRAALLHVSTYVTYKCVTVNGVCFGPYMDVFPCDVVSDDGLSCTLSGRTVLYITQGSSRTDTLWVPYMYPVVILVAYRIALLLLMIFPPDKVIATVKGIFASETNDVLVKGMASLRRIEGAQQCNRHYSLILIFSLLFPSSPF